MVNHFDIYDLKRLRRYYRKAPRNWKSLVLKGETKRQQGEWDYLLHQPKSKRLKYVSFRKAMKSYI